MKKSLSMQTTKGKISLYYRVLSQAGPGLFFRKNTSSSDPQQSHTEYVTKIKGIKGGNYGRENKVGECGG